MTSTCSTDEVRARARAIETTKKRIALVRDVPSLVRGTSRGDSRCSCSSPRRGTSRPQPGCSGTREPLHERREHGEVDGVAGRADDAELERAAPSSCACASRRARAQARSRRRSGRARTPRSPQGSRGRNRHRPPYDQSSPNPSSPTSGTKRQGIDVRSIGPSGVRATRTSSWPEPRAAWDDETAAFGELVVERWRDRRSCRGDGDRVERRALWHAERAVADTAPRRSPYPASASVARAPLGELGDALDRDHLRSELGEHGCLVSRAGADVEDALAPLQGEERADRRDDERLRDRLAVSDRKRAVVISMRAQARPARSARAGRAPSPRGRARRVMPRRRSWRSTICARATAASTERAHFASVRSPANRAAWRPRMRAARIGNATAST